MSRIRSLQHSSWSEAADPDAASVYTTALERDHVLFFPHLPFPVGDRDGRVFSPAILSSSKNASYDPATDRVGGTTLSGGDREHLAEFLRRFSAQAQALVDVLLPAYAGHLVRSRASFRPAEIAGRQTSWRKDDTRLHVDSFPATPVQGRRILRVFSNVNPHGRPRTWRVGGEFGALAERFSPALSMPLPGLTRVRQLLRLTKTLQTPYDVLMLQLHDRMKADDEFQRGSEQESFDFPAGSTWLAFTDSVSHAATAGQYQLEQTFLLPVEAMREEVWSPLRILERLKGRALR